MPQRTLGVFNPGKQYLNGYPTGFIQGLVNGAQSNIIGEIKVVKA
jgi:hypothetical protein